MEAVDLSFRPFGQPLNYNWSLLISQWNLEAAIDVFQLFSWLVFRIGNYLFISCFMGAKDVVAMEQEAEDRAVSGEC